MGDPTKTFSFTAWTSDVQYCDPFTYTATYSDNSPVSSPLTINSGTRTFTLTLTTLSSYVGVHTVILKGTLATGSIFSTLAFNIEVLDPCIYNTVTTSQTFSIINLKVSEYGSLQISNFISNVTTFSCGPWTY